MSSKKTNIIKTCISCKKEYKIEVNTSDLYSYMNGKLVQNAFPYLSVGERELLVSGMCDKCFIDMFKDDNEEPEENMPESYEYNNRD